MHLEWMMSTTWKDHIYRKRAELADILHVPMASLAHACLPLMGNRLALNEKLVPSLVELPTAPVCTP
jgi:hypothetical protein